MSRNNLTTAIILHHGLGSIWHLPFFSSPVLSMILDQVQSLNDEYDGNKAGILDGGDDFDASNCNEDTHDTEEDEYGIMIII